MEDRYLYEDRMEQFIADAMTEYHASAPAVEAALEDLYQRCLEAPQTVSLFELRQVHMLRDGNGTWEHPNFAQNRIYKVRSLCGLDTVGMLSF